MAGTAISHTLSLFVQDSNEREVVLGEKGELRIRCVWYRPGDAAAVQVLRAPSIAYVDCTVVDPRQHAEARAVDEFLAVPDLAVDVGTLLQQQLTTLNEALSKPASDEYSPSVQATAKAKQEANDLQSRIDHRRNVLQDKASTVKSARFVASFVLDSGPTVPLMVEAAELADSTFLVLDSTTKKGRSASASGTKLEAISAALKSLLEDGDYGRGYCSVIIWVGTGARDWERRTFRVEKSARGLLSEMLDGVSLILSVVAVLAAPFTGGASLALMIPAGLIGAVPAAMRIADRNEQGTLEVWSLETALDCVDVAGAFLGIAGKAAGSMRFIRLGKGFTIADRFSGGAGLVLGNEQFFRQLEEIGKSSDLPAVKNHRITMLFANKLLSEGISAGARLMEHATKHQPPGAPDPFDNLVKPVHMDDATFADIKANSKTTRQVDQDRVGLPAHLRADLGLMRSVKELTGRDIRVVRDDTLPGKSAEVRYSLDRFGFISEVYIAFGKDAGATQVRSHAVIADHLAGYMTMFGRLRTLFLRAFAIATGESTKDVGKQAWESALEIKKLNMQLIDHLRSVGKSGLEDSPAWWDDYARGLLEQMAHHENQPSSVAKGGGAIAARQLVQTPLARLNSEAQVLLRGMPGKVLVKEGPESLEKPVIRRLGTGDYEIQVPKVGQLGLDALSGQLSAAIKRFVQLSLVDNRPAADEAELRGLPPAEPPGHWAYRDKHVAYEGNPKRAFDPDSRSFVDVQPYLDIQGQPTEAGIKWLAKQLGKSEERTRTEFSGNDFERLVRHEHGGEAVAKRSQTFLVFLTKEMVKGKPVEPTLNRVAMDLLKALGLQDRTDEAAAILNRAAGELIDQVPGLKRIADNIRTSGNKAWIATLDEFIQGKLAGKKPDLVEFDINANRGYITDFTLAGNNPVHNLKTLVYRVMLEQVTGAKFEAFDWRSASHSKPITYAVKTRPYTKSDRRKQQRQRRTGSGAGSEQARR